MTEPMHDGADDGVDNETRNSEQDEAYAAHRADRPPTEEEEALAEGLELDPDVAEHEREMGERGAEVRGEGQIG